MHEKYINPSIPAEFKNILNSDEYSFLHSDRFKYTPIIYLTLGGSKAYGTNNENSDTDIRGAFIESPYSLLTHDTSIDDQFNDVPTDTVLYSLRKFIKLLTSCNPNVIEMLGTKDEHILFMHPIGKLLRENSELFLSKRAYMTFAGYATAQLRRLENALARDQYDQSDKEKHILKSLNAEKLLTDKAFKDLNKNNNLELYIDDSKREDVDKEIFVNMHIENVPLRYAIAKFNGMNNMLRNYDKINHRNRKKDENHLNKHAMHLIRLYLMGIDILDKKEIHTYRDKEHDLLMSIRNGEMPFADVFKLQKQLEEKMDHIFMTSDLPDEPRTKDINDLMFKIYINYIACYS